MLADGHHRYRTALKYRDEQRDAHDGVAGPYDLVMALVVELEEGGLDVGPIHRALSGTPGLDSVLETVRKWFDVVDAGQPDDSVLSAVTSSNALAMVSKGGIWLLTPRPEAYEAANSDLDSSLVALVTDAMPGTTSMHFHTAGRGRARREARRCRCGAARAPGHSRPDPPMGPRSAPHATQVDVLLSEAAHRHGLPEPRELNR